MIGRAAILYTDSFILISGLLTSFSMIKELDREKKLNVKRSFISRYVRSVVIRKYRNFKPGFSSYRFTPNLLIIILACTYLTDFLGPGPQWGLVVSKYSNLCKHNMWRNFLYIHNYFGFEEMVSDFFRFQQIQGKIWVPVLNTYAPTRHRHAALPSFTYFRVSALEAPKNRRICLIGCSNSINLA